MFFLANSNDSIHLDTNYKVVVVVVVYDVMIA